MIVLIRALLAAKHFRSHKNFSSFIIRFLVDNVFCLFKNEQWCCATILNGFILWHVSDERVQKLKLPNDVRNITKRFNTSSNIILSKGDKLAVTGIR